MVDMWEDMHALVAAWESKHSANPAVAAALWRSLQRRWFNDRSRFRSLWSVNPCSGRWSSLCEPIWLRFALLTPIHE